MGFTQPGYFSNSSPWFFDGPIIEVDGEQLALPFLNMADFSMAMLLC